MKILCEGGNLIPEHEITIKSGTKLFREYKGVKHEVIAEGDKYKYQGKLYNSLSKIAREITGTQWNGKLFFGVKKS